MVRTVRAEELATRAYEWAYARLRAAPLDGGQDDVGPALAQPGFYERVFARMPENLEVVVAERRRTEAGRGRVQRASQTHSTGDIGGASRNIRFLHFNVCLYHSIEECIRRGVKAFEGGAGGEHKIPRGFEPSETFSSHLFLDPRLDFPIREVHRPRSRGARARRWPSGKGPRRFSSSRRQEVIAQETEARKRGGRGRHRASGSRRAS